MTSVYFFDEQQHLLRIVNEKDLVEVIQEKEITSNKEELLHDTLNVSTIYNEELIGAFYMAIKESKDFYSLYRIVVDSEADDILSFVGIAFAPDELNSYVVKNVSVKNLSIKTTLQKLLAETEWQIGKVDSSLSLVTADFSYLSIRDALKELQMKGCEILFKYKIDGIGITKKWVEVYREIGEQSNQRFTYGDKALSIVKEQDRNDVYTSLIGRGRGEEVGDGKGKRTEFTTIEWKKSNGDPLDKPEGQNWVEFPEMTKQYGIPLKNGGMRKREKVITFDEIEEPKELLQQTYKALIDYSRPLIQFKTEILGGDTIGNTVTIHHHERNYHYQTRIFKVKIDFLTGKVEAGLGDNITRSMSKAASDLKGNIASLEEKKMTFYDSEEISKWQDDVIRGAKGGSIKLMNGIETKKSDSRKPYQMVFMDGSAIDKSKHFLVMNSEGIGFVKDSLENKFESAWTIDGKFNADFIQAGTIRGRNIEGCEFRTLDKTFQIKIFNGTIVFSDKNVNKRLGSISATLSNNEVNGFAVIQQPGFIFSLNSGSKDKEGTSNYVIQIPKESTMEEPKLNSRAEWKHNGDLHINGKLFLNGKEVTIGGTGGGSDGNLGSREDYAKNMITAEFNVDYEKMYNSWVNFGRIKTWGINNRGAFNELNAILKNNGVSPVFFWAYESGEGYHPDLSFLNHFYKNGSSYQEECKRTAGWLKDTSDKKGNLAWFDAQYPYYTSPADKQQIGNAYMQSTQNGMIARVMLQGTAAATWAMFDPAALKGSVNGVQDYSDPFKHQINLIKSWQREGVNGYILPVLQGTPITSWFGPRGGTMHNGIDFAGKTGDPIFAAQSGTVVYSYYDNDMGEWIVIKHDNDAYMTGYAHNSERLVKVGDKVSKGQQIARMGSTGDSTGPHLHFAVQTDKWSGYIDPAPFLGLTPS